VERNVELGAPIDDRVPVLAGLDPGDLVVTEGVFFLRAERERLRGGRQP
jgi:multidrug efflux pump subunit AcrA (membrane-fusion protein)